MEWNTFTGKKKHESRIDIFRWYFRIFFGLFWLVAFHFPLFGEKFDGVGMLLIYIPVAVMHGIICLAIMREHNV